MDKRYNKELANRFIKDYSLRISNINKDNFFFQLVFFDEKEGTVSKWNNTWKIIDNDFSGDANNFIEACHEDVKNAVGKITSNKEYHRFCEFNFTTDLCNLCAPTKFTPEPGKLYMSIDLIKANFQALNTFSPDIFDGATTYEQWISSFAKNKHTQASKYVRQVIFGQCNPSRQISMEKTIMFKVSAHITSNYSDKFKLVSANSDELIYEVDPGLVPDGLSFDKVVVGQTSYEYSIYKETGASVRCKFFKVKKYHLETESGHVRNGFYVKHYMTGKTEQKGVEKQYAMIVDCLLRGVYIPEECYHFNADGLDAIINEKFNLIEDK